MMSSRFYFPHKVHLFTFQRFIMTDKFDKYFVNVLGTIFNTWIDWITWIWMKERCSLDFLAFNVLSNRLKVLVIRAWQQYSKLSEIEREQKVTWRAYQRDTFRIKIGTEFLKDDIYILSVFSVLKKLNAFFWSTNVLAIIILVIGPYELFKKVSTRCIQRVLCI